MYFIIRTPDATPGAPDAAQVVEIDLRRGDHVEGVPIFVGARPGWSYWIVSLPSKEGVVETLLLGMRAQRGSNPGHDASAAREVYQSVRRFLKLWNQRR